MAVDLSHPMPDAGSHGREPALSAWVGVLLLLLALLPSAARACSTHGTSNGDVLHAWVEPDSDGNGFHAAFVAIEDVLVVPSESTICVSGVGFGDADTRLPPTTTVMAARIAILNLDTQALSDLSAFGFSDNANTTAGLVDGAGAGTPANLNPLIDDAEWFGFSAPVDPFVVPSLAPNEILVLGFDLDVPVSALPLNIKVQFAAGEGDSLGNPLFAGAHPPTYFSTSSRDLVLVPEPERDVMSGAALAVVYVVCRWRRKSSSEA